MAVFEKLTAGDPRRVGRYRIVARLGAGGMGQVYLGRSPGGRAVAVKIVRPELADDPDFRKRFVREVAAARRVNGAFTAGVVDADAEGTPAWLATSYVPGMSLGEAVGAHGPWPADAVLALGAALAEALEAIHAAGVIHRDLKPSNVLLAADGPRVIDFGISVVGGASALTGTGMVVGTPGFMAPEQVVGGPVGPACDVFALGAVLAYTAAAVPPFGTGPAHAVNFRAVYEEPDLTAVPPVLRELVGACLAKEAAGRPTLPELMEQLTSVDEEDAPVTGLSLTGTDWLPALVAGDLRHRLSTAVPASPAASPAPVPAMPEAELRPAAGKPAPSKSRPSEPVPSKSRPSEPAPADADEPAEHAAPAKSLETPETPETPETAETPEPDRTTATVVLMRARAAKASAVSTPSLSRPTRRHILLSVAGVTAAAGVSTAIAAVAERYDKDGGPSSGSGSKAASEWTVAFPGTISEPPIVTGGLVYALTANGHARALDAATGEERWSADIGSVGLDTPGIAVTAGTAYLVGSSSVQALDAVTGDRKWTFSADSPLKGRLQVAGDTLCTGGELAAYAIDATSGKQRWKVRRRDFLAWEPAVGDGKTYLASDNTVTAVDASTGTRSWTFGVDDGRSSTPWLVAGMVLVAGARWDNENRTQRATLHAVDTATGKERWKVPTPYVVDTLGAAGDLIYAEMVQMAVCALDAGTGKQRWSFRTGSSGSVRPVVSGDTLLVGGRGNRLTALNAATGVERWSFSAADALWADPAVAGGVVYIADRSGTLSALDAATGERRWAMDTQGAVKERPVVAHDVIYVPAGSKLHALPLKGRGVTRG